MKGLDFLIFGMVSIILLFFLGMGFVVGDAWGFHRSCKIKAEMSNDEFYVGE